MRLPPVIRPHKPIRPTRAVIPREVLPYGANTLLPRDEVEPGIECMISSLSASTVNAEKTLSNFATIDTTRGCGALIPDGKRCRSVQSVLEGELGFCGSIRTRRDFFLLAYEAIVEGVNRTGGIFRLEGDSDDRIYRAFLPE